MVMSKKDIVYIYKHFQESEGGVTYQFWEHGLYY